MKINWTKSAAKDVEYWKKHNKKNIIKIKELIEAIKSNPFEGIGKPEPLKGNLSGIWSRRITRIDRLLYRVRGSEIDILACRHHYKI